MGDLAPSVAHYAGTIAEWRRATLGREWEVKVEVVDKDAAGREQRRLQSHYEFQLADSWLPDTKFWIGDETGRVLVDADAIAVEAPLLHSELVGARVPGFGDAPCRRITGLRGEQEWRLHDGDVVFCLGHARINDTEVGAVLDGSGGEEFLVTVESPAAVTRRRRTGT